MTTPRIVALPFGEEKTPSTRYRLLQFLPGLAAAGLTVELVPAGEVKKAKTLKNLAQDGRVEQKYLWIQKKLLPLSWILRLRRRNRIIFDFDDAIWTVEGNSRSLFTRLRTRCRLALTLRSCFAVIAGNAYLADFARRYCDRVYVIPTVIDAQLYRCRTHVNEDVLTLGWIGQSVNFRYLEQLQEVFVELSKRIQFRLLVIADRDFVLPGVDVVNRRWSLAGEIDDLMACDIGLMPLEDSEWARGKCAFKAIQYMACGIPAVISPVGANVELIRNGENGFLAATTQEWIAAIELLYHSPQLRADTGAAARDTVIKHYSLESALPRLIEVFSQQQRSDNGTN